MDFLVTYLCCVTVILVFLLAWLLVSHSRLENRHERLRYAFQEFEEDIVTGRLVFFLMAEKKEEPPQAQQWVDPDQWRKHGEPPPWEQEA